MERDEPLVRCVECRREYGLPPRGEEIACPDCGCPSWVSTRISDEPLVPAPEAAERRVRFAAQARWM
jgi:DNA-directed RNA polymerase subunit RPC12/RpoP